MHLSSRSTRRLIAGVLTLILLFGGVAYALTDSDRTELEAIRADLVDALARIDALLATSTTVQETTTTTQATTTTPATTPTTTTTAPTTTTVLADPPPPSGDKFVIMLRGLDNPDTPQVEDRRFWWDADYYRNLSSGAHWVDGDRLGYNCAYMFITDENGRIVGRVIFARIAYAFVNDREMREGQRLIDGTFVGTGGQLYHPSFCADLLADKYTFSDTPDERPVVRYVGDRVLEVRDYTRTQVGEGLTFDVVSVSDEPFQITDPDGRTHTVFSRVTVIAREDGNAVVAVYYDSLSPDVRVTSDITP